MKGNEFKTSEYHSGNYEKTFKILSEKHFLFGIS
jgi:hypothetical protein